MGEEAGGRVAGSAGRSSCVRAMAAAGFALSGFAHSLPLALKSGTHPVLSVGKCLGACSAWCLVLRPPFSLLLAPVLSCSAITPASGGLAESLSGPARQGGGRGVV